MCALTSSYSELLLEASFCGTAFAAAEFEPFELEGVNKKFTQERYLLLRSDKPEDCRCLFDLE
jgi:hypothetical protein